MQIKGLKYVIFGTHKKFQKNHKNLCTSDSLYLTNP